MVCLRLEGNLVLRKLISISSQLYLCERELACTRPR